MRLFLAQLWKIEIAFAHCIKEILSLFLEFYWNSNLQNVLVFSLTYTLVINNNIHKNINWMSLLFSGKLLPKISYVMRFKNSGSRFKSWTIQEQRIWKPFTMRTNLPKLLDLLIFCIYSLNFSLEFFIMIFL